LQADTSLTRLDWLTMDSADGSGFFAFFGIGKLPAGAQYFIAVAVLLHVASFAYWVIKLGQKRSIQDDLKLKST
jgi:hypothetical protein